MKDNVKESAKELFENNSELQIVWVSSEGEFFTTENYAQNASKKPEEVKKLVRGLTDPAPINDLWNFGDGQYDTTANPLQVVISEEAENKEVIKLKLLFDTIQKSFDKSAEELAKATEDNRPKLQANHDKLTVKLEDVKAKLADLEIK
jgi:hypothetical protein